MARALVDIGTLIESIPGLYGGRPRLARSGLPIIQFVAEYKFGGSMRFGLAYYLANKESLDAELEERDREGEAAYQEWLRENGKLDAEHSAT